MGNRAEEVKYELLSVFKVLGENYYIIRIKGGVCTLDETEYRRFWGLNHQNHWKRRKAA